MRPIKFRAWDKKEKKFIHRPTFYIHCDGKIATWEVGNDQNRYMDTYHPNLILMQFTGLTDKNGREIWEGDLVKYNWLNIRDEDLRPSPYIVKIGRGEVDASDYEEYSIEIMGVYLEYAGTSHSAPDSICNIENEIEVIGNIYENPDLLNDSK